MTGLDIGSYSVKCVEIHAAGIEPELARAAVEPAGREEDLKNVLQKMQVSPFSSLRVGLSGSSIITRFITMPAMSGFTRLMNSGE